MAKEDAAAKVFIDPKKDEKEEKVRANPDFKHVKGAGSDDTNARYAAFCVQYSSEINALSDALKVAGLGDLQILAFDLACRAKQPVCVFRTRAVRTVLKGGRSSF